VSDELRQQLDGRRREDGDRDLQVRQGEVGSRERRFAVGVLLAAAALTVAYWVVWFLIDRSILASDTRIAYYEFENAFPLADGWLVLCLIGAAVQLLRRRGTALLWLLAGAGAGLYLAGMDILYDLEHQIWFQGGSGGLIELTINILTVVASLGLLLWSWRRRAALMAGN
jgi:hypothetical protein